MQAEVVEKILWLRQRYHFGPGKISMYLHRYHQIKISPSGVWRILHRAGVNAKHSEVLHEDMTDCPAPSAISAAKPGGSATRSSAPDTSCRSM